MTVNLSQLTLEADPNKIPLKIWFNMSKQNQIKDFPQNSCRANRVVIVNMGNSITVDLYGFKYSKDPYIRAEVLRTINLKFHNSFRAKLFVYRFFKRTLSMADSGGSRQNVDRVPSLKNHTKMRFLSIFFQIWEFWPSSRNLVTRSGSATGWNNSASGMKY